MVNSTGVPPRAGVQLSIHLKRVPPRQTSVQEVLPELESFNMMVMSSCPGGATGAQATPLRGTFGDFWFLPITPRSVVVIPVGWDIGTFKRMSRDIQIFFYILGIAHFFRSQPPKPLHTTHYTTRTRSSSNPRTVTHRARRRNAKRRTSNGMYNSH